jgi:RNA polymerase primary sigma factor
MNRPINSFTPTSTLTVEEETELASAIADGDGDALHKLIEANLGLVVTIAKNHLRKGLSLDDLVGEGTVGLTIAAKRFEPSLGIRFSTFAACWIKQAMIRALHRSTCVITIPERTRQLMRRRKAAQRALTGTLGRAPNSAEIVRSMRLTHKQAQKVQAALTAATVKFASAIVDEEESRAFEFELPEPAQGAEERKRELIDLLRRRIDSLNKRERAAVFLRYGFTSGFERPDRAIARRLRVSRESARGLLRSAEVKLRYPVPPPEV